MRLRKEVMEQYSQKVRNNDGFTPGILIRGLPQKFAEFRGDNFSQNFSNHRSNMIYDDTLHIYNHKHLLSDISFISIPHQL